MKYRISIAWFDLAAPANRVVVRLNGRAVSARVSAAKAESTWATTTLTVKRASGSAGPFDFPTARSIAAGGGSVFLNAGDLEGCTELEIKTSATEASAAASIEIEIEQENQVGERAPYAVGAGCGMVFGAVV